MEEDRDKQTTWRVDVNLREMDARLIVRDMYIGFQGGLVGGGISTVISGEPLMLPVGMGLGVWVGAAISGVRQTVRIAQE